MVETILYDSAAAQKIQLRSKIMQQTIILQSNATLYAVDWQRKILSSSIITESLKNTEEAIQHVV